MMIKSVNRSGGTILYSAAGIVVAAALVLWAVIAAVPPQDSIEQIRAQAESIDSYPAEVKDLTQFPNHYAMSEQQWIELTDHCGYDITAQFGNENAEENRAITQRDSSADNNMTAWCKYARDAYLNPQEKMMLAAHQAVKEFREFGSFLGIAKADVAETAEAAADRADTAAREMSDEVSAGLSDIQNRLVELREEIANGTDRTAASLQEEIDAIKRDAELIAEEISGDAKRAVDAIIVGLEQLAAEIESGGESAIEAIDRLIEDVESELSQ